MEKPKYPNGLRAAMRAAGVGPTQLASALDTNKQNITRWANGDRKLTVDWAKRLAPRLNTSPDKLLLVSAPPVAQPRVARGRPTSVPLLASVPAGRLWSADSVEPRNVRRTLVVSGLPAGGDWIALEVEGDSMDKIAQAGAVIFIDRRDQKLVRDRYYVFQTEAGEATFKRYRPSPDRLLPFSNNTDHEPIPLDEQPLFCVGRVRRVQLDV